MRNLNAIAFDIAQFATIGIAIGTIASTQPAQAATIDFASVPETITNQFEQNGLTVTGSNDLFIGDTLIANGLGVVGGTIADSFPPGLVNPDQYIDNTESVLFAFDSPANKNVLLRFGTLLELSAAKNRGTIEAFGVSGSSLGAIVLNDFSNSDFSISNLYDNTNISSFSYTAASGMGVVARQVSFTPVSEPGAITGLALLGIGWLWKKKGSLSSRKNSDFH